MLKASHKAVVIWQKTFLYSVSLSIILFLLGFLKTVSLYNILKTLFPFLLNEYWFITCYILLMLFVPFIDTVLNNLNQKGLLVFNMLLFCCQLLELVNNQAVSRFILAISGYVAGATIRINKAEILRTFRRIYLVLIMLAIYCFDLLSIFMSRLLKISFVHSAHFTQYAPAFVFAVSLFTLFITVKPFSNKYINLLSSGTFAVYLISEQVLVRPLLWNQIINVQKFQHSPFIYLISVGVSVSIYILFATVDVVVTFLVNKIYSLIHSGKFNLK